MFKVPDISALPFMSKPVAVTLPAKVALFEASIPKGIWLVATFSKNNEFVFVYISNSPVAEPFLFNFNWSLLLFLIISKEALITTSPAKVVLLPIEIVSSFSILKGVLV